MISSEGEERGREEMEKAGEWMKTRARNTSRHGMAMHGLVVGGKSESHLLDLVILLYILLLVPTQITMKHFGPS